MRGDARARDDSALPVLDLQCDGELQLRARQDVGGIDAEWIESAGRDRADSDLAVLIREIEAEIARPGFGQFDELRFQNYTVDRDVDQLDLPLDPFDTVRRTGYPDGVQTTVDRQAVAEILTERQFFPLRLLRRSDIAGILVGTDRTEAGRFANEDVVRLDFHAFHQQTDDFRHVGIFEHYKFVGIARLPRIDRAAIELLLRDHFLAFGTQRSAAQRFLASRACDPDLNGVRAHSFRPHACRTGRVEPHDQARSLGHECYRAHEAAVGLSSPYASGFKSRGHDHFGCGRIVVYVGDARLCRGKSQQECRRIIILIDEPDFLQHRRDHLGVRARCDRHRSKYCDRHNQRPEIKAPRDPGTVQHHVESFPIPATFLSSAYASTSPRSPKAVSCCNVTMV